MKQQDTKRLYEKIMKDISKIVKSKLNEQIELTDEDLTPYLINAGDYDIIDCDNINKLPKNIILNIVNALVTSQFTYLDYDQENPKNLTNEDFECDDTNYFINLNLSSIKNIEDENIYIRTIDYYNLCLFAHLSLDLDNEIIEWDETWAPGATEGSEYNYFVENFNIDKIYLLEDFCNVLENGINLDNIIDEETINILKEKVNDNLIDDIMETYNEKYGDIDPYAEDPMDAYKRYKEDNLFRD